MKTATSSRMQTRALIGAAVMMGLFSVAVAQSNTPSTTPAAGKVTNVSVPQGGVPASAQAAVTQTSAPAQATLTPPATNRVGDATTYLLALQASGQYASRNSYLMTSDVALRTYQRYLESFTHKIPESSETQVGNKSGGSH
ncbi:MAG: DUF3613 domain-containing protein [Comamonas sp.]|jgi:hypothetical protein|nr:DUF3613 domain-containing protein [Comamonas sp.]